MTRILLIEDHEAFRRSLELVLESRREPPDMEVVGRASSLEEARGLLSGGVGFDVAVVDLMLPDGDGAGLIGVLRGSSPHASVLVLTASGASERQRAFDRGADAVLGKEAGLGEILAALEQLSTASR